MNFVTIEVVELISPQVVFYNVEMMNMKIDKLLFNYCLLIIFFFDTLIMLFFDLLINDYSG
jgi:hypothetical protein